MSRASGRLAGAAKWPVGERARRARSSLADVRWQLGIVAAASTAVTVAFAVAPSLRLGYRAPSLHVALETAASLVALLAAFLVFGRMRREPRVSDLLLACGLAVVAVSNFSFGAVPAIADERSGRAIVWAAVAARLIGALLLAAAANAPPQGLRNTRRASLGGALGSAAVVAAAGVTAWALRYQLPASASLGTGADQMARHPDLVLHPAFSAIQLTAGITYLVAALGFARRAISHNDDFVRWLAVACVLSMFSRINYFLYPSAYTDWVYLGDAFRLSSFAVLLVAALKEIVAYWRVAAAAAVVDERTRLARDLHDGLAQEVALLRGGMRSLADGAGDPELTERLVATAERAQQESRQLLAMLAAPSPETFDVLFKNVIGELAGREGVRVELDVAPRLDLDHVRAEAMLRIAAEAVANAARHAGTDAVHVSVQQRPDGVRLRVTDHGRGFDPDAPPVAAAGHGFGLESMRDRARAVGAHFSLTSRPGMGTTVEVAL